MKFLYILCLSHILRFSVYTCGIFALRICVTDFCYVPATVYFKKRDVTVPDEAGVWAHTNAHGEATLAAKLKAHGKASIWMLCCRTWRSHVCGEARHTQRSERMNVMLSHTV